MASKCSFSASKKAKRFNEKQINTKGIWKDTDRKYRKERNYQGK